MDVVYLDFTQVFDTDFHKIPTEKLLSYGERVSWHETCLKSWAQKVVISNTRTGWRLVTSGVP